MVTKQYPQSKSGPISSLKAPAIDHSWRFGDLTAAELMPLLQQHLIAQDNSANWQLVWLNNDGKPVIGLLPKISWHVYFDQEALSAAPITTLQNDSSSLYKVLKTYRDKGKTTEITHTNYRTWQEELILYSKEYESNHYLDSKNAKSSYQHGLIGFIGYDLAAYELSSTIENPQSTQPCAALGHYDVYLSIDDEAEINQINWLLNVKADSADEQDSIVLTSLITYLDALDIKLSNTPDSRCDPILAPLTLTAQWQKRDYEQAFEQTQRYLQQGDCYQINLTQAWQAHLSSSSNNNSLISTLLAYLPSLQRNTHAPFAGYLGLGNLNNKDSEDKYSNNENATNNRFELLSCSPELFFTFTKDAQTNTHHILTKPIKGTMPRGLNTKQDKVLKQQLIDSEKDRSENVMIVDLLRNDLGKYAKTGSVKVPQLFAIESFSNVHHMVSTITAELKSNVHPLAVLFGSLPAGSITGTPKKRAVEIISELEAAPRGAYCGTMGYMNFDGSGQWNVLIRTLQANSQPNGDTQVSLWAGGGITVASECAAEYQECLDKVGNLLAVLAGKNTAS